MDEISIFQQLFKTTPTKKEAVALLMKLQQLSEGVFNIHFDIAHELDKALSLEEKENLSFICTKLNLHLKNPSDFEKLLQGLKLALEKIPVVNLTLGIHPTGELRTHLQQFLYTQLNQQFFLNLETSPSLIGGAVISAEGYIKDYSLKKIIQEKYGFKS